MYVWTIRRPEKLHIEGFREPHIQDTSNVTAVSTSCIRSNIWQHLLIQIWYEKSKAVDLYITICWTPW